MKKIKCLLSQLDGFIAVESIFVMTGVLFFTLFFISVLTYNYPRIMLEKEVQILAQVAKKQGGLTDETSQPIDSDIARFKSQLEAMGFDPEKVEVTATQVPSGGSAMGVTPINKTGTNYVKRDSRELIEIVVKAPARSFILDAPMKFLGTSSLSDVYVIREVVGSERW